METRPEVIVFGCRDDDLVLLNAAFGPTGPTLRVVASPAEFARDAVSRRPLGVFLGVGTQSVTNLEVISVIRAVRSQLPIVVVAESDSLELERSARQRDIFYYLVHPIDESEVRAVVKDLVRYTSS